MKHLIIIIAVLLLVGCQTKEEQLSQEAKKLQRETEVLREQINGRSLQLQRLNSELSKGESNLPEDKKRYVVMIQIKQQRTMGILDIEGTIKDEMNKISIPVEVSKHFYNSHSVGDKLKSDFRLGSFIMRGSWSSWAITIKEKKTIAIY